MKVFHQCQAEVPNDLYLSVFVKGGNNLFQIGSAKRPIAEIDGYHGSFSSSGTKQPSSRSLYFWISSSTCSAMKGAKQMPNNMRTSPPMRFLSIGLTMLLLLAGLSIRAFGVTPSYTKCEVDGGSQNGRVFSFPLPVRDGDFAHYPQPQILTWVGQTIVINSVSYTISSVADDSHLTLSATGGTQTGIAYTVSGRGQGIINVSGTAVTRVSGDSFNTATQTISVWQVDRKNQWTSTDFKFGIVSLVVPTVASTTCYTVTFVDNVASSSSGSGLTWSQMKNFNVGSGAGVYDAQIVVTPFNPSGSAAAVTVKMKDILNAIDPTANNSPTTSSFLWLSGPVVTCAELLDASTTSGGNYAGAFDFGYNWNGASMDGGGSASYSGTSTFASIHPWGEACYYTSPSNHIKFGLTVENNWTNRAQDQKYKFDINVGASATPSKVYDSTSVVGNSSGYYTHIFAARWHKTFYAGTAPGHLRSNPNFAYLVTTGIIPNYDQTAGVGADPSTADNCDVSDKCPTWPADWVNSDKAEINGYGLFYLFSQDWSSNWEGSPMQREWLMWLYNAGTATTSDGKAAKAEQIICGRTACDGDTLTSAGIDTSATTQYDVPGGAGMAGALNNAPIHMKESRPPATANAFWCPNWGLQTDGTGKDLTLASGTPSAACTGGLGAALGRPLSRHAFPTTGFQGSSVIIPVATVGARSSGYGGWGISNIEHWLTYGPDAYILTGDYFHYEDMLQEASYVTNYTTGDYAFGSANFQFAIVFPGSGGIRNWGWSMGALGETAAMAVDGTVEQSYYTGLLNSNLAFMEGTLGITGSAFTPTSTNATCSAFNYTSAINRWNLGHCVNLSFCGDATHYRDCTGVGSNAFTNALYLMGAGECSLGGRPDLTQWTINAVTRANPAVATTSATNNLGSGGNVKIWQSTGTPWSSNAYTGINNSNSVFIAGTNSGTAIQLLRSPSGSNFDTSGFANAFSGTAQVTNGFLDQRYSTDFIEDWMQWGALTVLGRLHYMGLTQVDNVLNVGGKRLLEGLLDTANNPYLMADSFSPAKDGATSCSDAAPSPNTTIGTWANFKKGFSGSDQGLPNFRSNSVVSGNFPCGTHGYALVARAAAAYLPLISTYTCPDGVTSCNGTNAWNFMAVTGGGAVPYYGNSEFNADSNCPTFGATLGPQVRFALSTQESATVTACTLSPSSASIAVGTDQAVTATCMYSDGSGPTSCTSDIALFTDNNAVASTSAQNIHGVGAGTANITGSTISNSTSCTPTIPVTVTAAVSNTTMKGVVLKGVVIK